MKTVIIGRNRYRFPNRFISAAYAGACTAHQLQRHNAWGLRIKKGDFRKIFEYVTKNIKEIVKSLPRTMSLKVFVKRAPANHEFGGF